MFKEILDSFANLIETVRKSPQIAILTLLLVIALVAVAKSYSNEIKLNEITFDPQRNKEHLEASIKASEQINQALSISREKLDADKIIVRQFHNGKQDLTGIPFNYVQTTFLVTKPGIGLDADSLDSKPVSSMVYTLKDIWGNNLSDPHCVVYNREQIKDRIFQAHLLSTNIEFLVICPIKNLLDYPVGFVTVKYTKDITPEKHEEIIKESEFLSLKISGYLSDITKPKEEGFLQNLF